MVTIYDIAKRANVSAMTVSRVINDSGRISAKTREKVKRIMDELNYVPNSTARSLVKQETKMLSLLITDITNPFFTTLARGAEDAALELGYKLLFGNSDEKLAKEREYVDMVLSTRVDGLLFAPASDASIEHLNMLDRHRIPYVLVDRDVPGTEADVVLGENRLGADQLTDYLIGLGHRRIALVNGYGTVSTARERYGGYCDALARHGIHYDESLVVEYGYNRFDDPDKLERLLALPNPPTALFAANNVLAVSVISFLRDKGIGVPEQISVVCFEDVGLASKLDPFLTVAVQPAYDFGYKGIHLLAERIRLKDEMERRIIRLPSAMIVRKSAAAPPKTSTPDF
ncbi:LacI family DNA-binding transcriptional regulator [Paenibacillus ginsengarvi]|uniref:LacI family transcriptional regulator n=1 Tax=Paenibacillus ginsengarvi TaxID=400777 RepID=A0A3B0CFR7_9BACL|nr:LacI family DNA-binding transcriptional regulator [Paenibacillus ginsengarvi]RKN84755.1 LacI family transcriptional regulator [Paenibacillus ginsengarvi]